MKDILTSSPDFPEGPEGPRGPMGPYWDKENKGETDVPLLANRGRIFT